jgi:hypothetical protein
MSPKKKKTRSTSSTFKYPMLIESGTEEYQRKKRVEVERIDARGVFRRSRVVDQTAFDKLFIEGDINRKQFSAAEMYLELMGIAGCFLRSPSMSGSERVSGRDVGGNMASKILVISKARDSLRRSGQDALIAVEACLANDVKVDLESLKLGLDALVVHFRIA